MNDLVAIAAVPMRSSNISALVVKDVVRTEGNTAVGMFTERDVVRAIAEDGAAGANLKVSQFISVQQLASAHLTDSPSTFVTSSTGTTSAICRCSEHDTCIGVVSIRDISTAFDEEANAQLAISA